MRRTKAKERGRREEEPSRRQTRRADAVRVQARRLITYGAIKNEESYTLELTEDNVETVLDEVKATWLSAPHEWPFFPSKIFLEY